MSDVTPFKGQTTRPIGIRGERLFELRRDTDSFVVGLRYHDGIGVEVQVFLGREFLYGRLHKTRVRRSLKRAAYARNTNRKGGVNDERQH